MKRTPQYHHPSIPRTIRQLWRMFIIIIIIIEVSMEFWILRSQLTIRLDIFTRSLYAFRSFQLLRWITKLFLDFFWHVRNSLLSLFFRFVSPSKKVDYGMYQKPIENTKQKRMTFSNLLHIKWRKFLETNKHAISMWSGFSRDVRSKSDFLM
jgi:hypothetical protein